MSQVKSITLISQGLRRMILKVLGQKCNLGFKLIFGKVRIKLQYLILGNDF